MEIKNNVFIITGGASGLGAASARMIVDNGGKVVLADVQVEAGEKLAAELNGKFVKCDVTSEADGLAVTRRKQEADGGAQQHTAGSGTPHTRSTMRSTVSSLPSA